MKSAVITDLDYAGYQQFENADGEPYGSFEVFYLSQADIDQDYTEYPPGYSGETETFMTPGFYWWPCFPGCLPDGEPVGPFNTAQEAYFDAINE